MLIPPSLYKPVTFLRNISLLALILLSGCASLQDKAPVKPEAYIQGVQISGLTTQSVDLLVDLAIKNPNAFGLNASGFDMNLSVEGNQLAKIEENDKGLKLGANSTSTTQVPLTLQFKDIYDAVTKVKDQDEFNYAIEGGVSFKLPIIGEVRLPTSFSGTLPIPQMPKVSIRSASFSDINWRGASMLIELDVNNPNKFGLDLNSLNYQIQAAGQSLGGGKIQSVSLGENSSQTLSIPLSLSFSQLGSSLISMITSGKDLDLNMTGSLDLAPALELWNPETMNFDLKGLLKK